MKSSVQVDQVSVRYGTETALQRISVDIPEATSLAVIGPNGSGKSTLLNAITGLVPTSEGKVRYSGAAPAYVMQSTAVDRSLPITVRETVSLGRYPARGLLRRFGPDDHAIVDEAMERLDVSELANKQLHDLSGGQRQRVFVAQGLAQDSDLLLLDEPITGLDLPSQKAILMVIADETARGRSVILTTHDLDDAKLCDQVLLLDRHVIAVGPPGDVLTEDNLIHAFGGRFIRVGDRLLLDDPHHHHEH